MNTTNNNLITFPNGSNDIWSKIFEDYYTSAIELIEASNVTVYLC